MANEIMGVYTYFTVSSCQYFQNVHKFYTLIFILRKKNLKLKLTRNSVIRRQKYKVSHIDSFWSAYFEVNEQKTDFQKLIYARTSSLLGWLCISF